jgi:uncharacterized repeat protein (TIGR03803 family)
MKLKILAFAGALMLATHLSAQTFTTLHSFVGYPSDGIRPYAGLILSGNTFFGTASAGGSGYNGDGVVFSINTDGSDFTLIHSFISWWEGDLPTGDLTLLGNTLYGTAADGGTPYFGCGTIFSVNINGSNFTVLHTFGDSEDGAAPRAGMVLLGKTLYGTALQGGTNGGGVVFSVNTDTTNFTVIHSFKYSDGELPLADLVLSGNTLYGTTEYGGGGNSPNGTVFSIKIDGTRFASLYSFTATSGIGGRYGTNSDGAEPQAGLILSGSTLYGTTAYGGSSGYGTVFAINTNGSNFKILHSFTATSYSTNSDGANPFAGLILSGYTLYGTTQYGGSSGNGTVFAVNTDGTGFKNLYSFTALSNNTNSDGANPMAGLILAANTLYGTTSKGGVGVGTVFALSLAPSAPAIKSQPQNQTLQVGSNVTFSVVASGWPSPNYQWQFNGQNLAGRTEASLSLTNVQFANAGGYSVIVTNAYGSVTSAIAQLTVFTNLVVAQTNRTPTTNEIGQPAIPTSNYFKVFTNGNFYSGIALNPNKNTIVLTHGWNGKPSNWAAYAAQIIQQRIGINTANIVAWDWSGDAQSDFFHLGVIAAKTPREGYALGTNLVAALGANYSQRIHFIGHSLGTLVNAAAANYIHTNGFSWTNTQMTLCDEAEVAWTFTSAGWQMATTLPEIIGQAGSTLATFDGNFSTPQPGWANPLPNQFAWADNYVSAFGMLHSNAANVILTQNFPVSLPDVGTVAQEFYNFHDYAHFFYEDTIEPGLFNTGGAINATYAGFICSFEGGGYAGRPGTNTYFYQDPNGLELSLIPTDLGVATNLLNARFKIYQSIGVSSAVSQGENGVFGSVLQAVGQVNGQIENTGQNLENMVLNFLTSVSGGSLVKSAGAQPLGGPVPAGTGSGNTPAYAWVPLNVPSNALWMSFDFMLQGNGNNDSFQVALNGTNVLSEETSLIQTNVLLNSGMIDVSPYAGQQVTLFMGIVGGTSTNAALTASDFQFYVALPPSLQIQLAGTNVVLTWPMSATGYVLQSANQLTPPVSWTTVTNVPVIVNFQYTVTNQISSGSVFYRLAIATAPALQAQVSGKNFILSWPASASGYVLETTTNLAATNSWTAITNMPATVNQQSVVTNQISGAARFYRLISR